MELTLQVSSLRLTKSFKSSRLKPKRKVSTFKLLRFPLLMSSQLLSLPMDSSSPGVRTIRDNSE